MRGLSVTEIRTGFRYIGGVAGVGGTASVAHVYMWLHSWVIAWIGIRLITPTAASVYDHCFERIVSHEGLI